MWIYSLCHTKRQIRFPSNLNFKIECYKKKWKANGFIKNYISAHKIISNLSIIKWTGNFYIKQFEIAWIASVLPLAPWHQHMQNLTLNRRWLHVPWREWETLAEICANYFFLINYNLLNRTCSEMNIARFAIHYFFFLHLKDLYSSPPSQILFSRE